MADTQNVIYAQAYSRNIMQLAQQKYSKLINTVYLKPNVRGKTFFQDQIGAWAMEVKGGRNVQTPNNDPSLARRMGIMIDYHDNRLLDRGDELKCISDPRSAYTIAAAQSLGRQMDDVIIAALIGTAYSGETGTDTNTIGTTQIVASKSGDGLTLAKVVEAKKILDKQDIEAEDRFIIVSPDALEDMLNTTTVTSADYNSVKALVKGEIPAFLGFNWIMSTRLTNVSSTRACIAFHKYGLCLAMADAPLVRTDERRDLSYSWQVYYELNIGAVRLEENRVVRVDVSE